jgi:hypothetical protein
MNNADPKVSKLRISPYLSRIPFYSRAIVRNGQTANAESFTDQVSRDSSDNELTLGFDLGDTTVVLNTPSAYDCCVACINTLNCAGSNWISSFYEDGESCELDIFDVCPAGQTRVAGTYYIGNDLPNTLSNGPCGYYEQQDSVATPQ